MRPPQREGWTLAELLISLAVLVVIGAVVSIVYLTIWNGIAVFTARSLTTSQLRNSLEQFGRDVQAAREAPQTCPGNTYPVSSTQVVLDIPSIADCVVYRCAGGACTLASPGRLERLIAPGGGAVTSTRVLSRSVTTLTFTRQDLDGVSGTIERVDVRLRIANTTKQF